MNNNLACQEDAWEELIGGKLVEMFPRPSVNHNSVAYNIATLFHIYLKGKKCTAFADGTDLYLDEENRFVPDGMVVCDPDKIRYDGVHGAPDLVVEVLSPARRSMTAGGKRTLTKNAASASIGSLTRRTKQLNSTCSSPGNSCCMTPTPYSPTGCWKR